MWYPRDFPEKHARAKTPFVEPAPTFEHELEELDFLAIFDCCFAAGILNHYELEEGSPWERRCEVLSAAGVEYKAGGGKDNFTEVLIELLSRESSKQNGIKASSLYNHLTNKNNINVKKLQATPNYHRHNYDITSSIIMYQCASWILSKHLLSKSGKTGYATDQQT